jgi:hypothetical protein
LSAVLLGSALAMVNNAGGKMPIGVIFGAPILVGIVGYVMHLRSRDRHPASKPPIGKPTVPATKPGMAAGTAGIATAKAGLTARERS